MLVHSYPIEDTLDNFGEVEAGKGTAELARLMRLLNASHEIEHALSPAGRAVYQIFKAIDCGAFGRSVCEKWRHWLLGQP